MLKMHREEKHVKTFKSISGIFQNHRNFALKIAICIINVYNLYYCV